MSDDKNRRQTSSTQGQWLIFCKAHRQIAIQLLFLILLPSFSHSQIDSIIHFFPAQKFVHEISSDFFAHQMGIENRMGTKDIFPSLGGIFPVVNINVGETEVQASLGSSVHFEVQAGGQAHVVSTEFYIDYLILDIPVKDHFYYRFVTGHTSHHLSDNYYQLLGLPYPIHYSRDYIQSHVIYTDPAVCSASLGFDYAYIFHLAGKEYRRWKFDASVERTWFSLTRTMSVYTSFDWKVHQEAGWAASGAYQIGVELPMQPERRLRFAYEFRHGLDECGQFFPRHIHRHMIGLFIEV